MKAWILFLSLGVFLMLLLLLFRRRRQEIPKQIFLTHKVEYDDLPQVMKENIENTKRLNPGYEIRYYSDSDAEKFIREHFPEYLDDFRVLVPGAYKADLLRLLLLYTYGGVYNDIGHMYLRPIDTFIPTGTKLLVCKDIGFPHWPEYYLHNAIIASTPGHSMIKKAIDVLVENVRNRFYGNTILDPTGPGAFGKAFNLHFGRNENEAIMPGMFDLETKVINHIGAETILDTDTGETRIIRTKFDNYYDIAYPGKNRSQYYSNLWFQRKIYSI